MNHNNLSASWSYCTGLQLVVVRAIFSTFGCWDCLASLCSFRVVADCALSVKAFQQSVLSFTGKHFGILSLHQIDLKRASIFSITFYGDSPLPLLRLYG